MKSFPRSTDALLALLLITLVAGTILATGPIADVPRNDDFAYARSAQVLASEGKLEFKMANAMALPQLAYGALAIKLWGFSYYVLDLTGFLAAALATGAMYLLARASGSAPLASCLATGALTLNPIFLAIAPSFMTDLPGLLFLLVSLLVLVASLGTDAGGVVFVDQKRLVLSALLGLIAGAERQINWVAFLGALAMLCLLLPRQRRLVVAVAIALFAGASLLTLWFGAQPNTASIGATSGIKDLIQSPEYLESICINLYLYFILCGIFLLPLTISTLAGLHWRSIRCWYVIALVCLLALPRLCLPDFRLPAPGQYFTAAGVWGPWVHGFENRPPMIPPFAISALIILGTLGTVCFALVLIRWCVEILSGNGRFHAVQQVATSLLLSASLAQIPAMIPWMTKGNLFDRYLLAFLPGLLIFLASKIKNYDFTTNLSILLILIIWFIGFAMASEYAAYTRARAALFEYLLARGVPRREIDGGYEFSGDTQLLNAGQLYHPPGSRGKYTHYAPKAFPTLDARYRLSTAPDADPRTVRPDPVATTMYRSLLPPQNRKMYIYKIVRD